MQRRERSPARAAATAAALLLAATVALALLQPANAAEDEITTEITPTFDPAIAGRLPYRGLLVLPEFESDNDKFRLTIRKARPVIDEAIEEAVRRGYMPKDWLNISEFDSRFYEDASLAEKHSVVGVVKAYCAGELDMVLGFADSYGLATVAKVSAGFNKGIPVMTTAGMPSLLSSRKSFPNLIRMQGSYTNMAAAMYELIAYREPSFDNVTGLQEPTSSLNYLRMLFMYHDKKRAVNRRRDVIKEKKNEVDETASSHCYFSLYAIKNYFQDKSTIFKNEWSVITPSGPLMRRKYTRTILGRSG